MCKMYARMGFFQGLFMKHDNTNFKEIISTLWNSLWLEKQRGLFHFVSLLCFIIVETGFSFEEKHKAKPY